MYTAYQVKNIFRSWFADEVNRESFDAYFDKIPENIQVSWKRDGDMIVGKVTAGNEDFYTQGRDVDDFIEMVNDAIYTVYDIPFQYLKLMRTFSPSQEALRELNDSSVTSADLLMSKKKELQTV